CHLNYMLDMAEQEIRHLFGPHPAPALYRLEIEIDNLRASLTYSQSDNAPQGSLLRLASALWLFWDIRGYYWEGRDHLCAALNKDALRDTEFRAQALLGAAVMADQ